MIVQTSPVRMVAPVLMESMDSPASVRPATLVLIVRQVSTNSVIDEYANHRLKCITVMNVFLLQERGNTLCYTQG